MRLLLIILLLPIFSIGQPGFSFNPKVKKPKINSSHLQRTNRLQAIEICGNGIDDDGNELADEKDFSCYYSTNGTDGCAPSKIIWGCSASDLYWGDVETGAIHYVGNMNGLGMIDITWASNGKLYAKDYSYIYEINPYTAFATIAFEIPDYYTDNALTSDNEGNLYFPGAPMSDPQSWYGILKMNMTTLEVTQIADLRSLGLGSAGDLAFLNGRLYLTCVDKKMAVINTGTGVVTAFTLRNSTTDGSWGLITLGDGYLYQSDKNKIYQIDPSTMIVSSTPYFQFNKDSVGFSGLCNYTEHCNAPACKATLNIDLLSGKPFCSSAGVQLCANGNGIRGEVIYEWTLPDKSSSSEKLIKAVLPGMYYVQYSGVTDFCAAKDSIFLDITQTPGVDLGNDKFLCDGTTIELIPAATPNNVNFLWGDMSTGPKLTVSAPGEYKVEVSNVCGYARDSITILKSAIPQVYLGTDTAVCPGSDVVLNNLLNRQREDIYKWSDLSSGNNLIVGSPGLYWLESSNPCGMTRDSMLVSFKDSCSCFPFYPALNVGPDIQVCDYETTTLANLVHQEGFRYNWITGSIEQRINVKTAGVYWVDASTYCGTVRDSIVIDLKTDGCERNVFIPSAFTPNNDGKNDIFKPIIFGILDRYEFTIYNRWGQVVFYTKDTNRGWDGTLNGKKQNAEIFVWNCSYRFSGVNSIHKKGTVALIR